MELLCYDYFILPHQLEYFMVRYMWCQLSRKVVVLVVVGSCVLEAIGCIVSRLWCRVVAMEVEQ